MAQKKIKSNVQKATFNLGALSEVDLTLEANPGCRRRSFGTNLYSVIAGTYRSMENAEKKLAQLQAGFDALSPGSIPKALIV